MFKFHENRNENCEKMMGEKEIEKYMDSDLQCLSHLPANFGDQYCQCGRKRSVNPCEFANFWYTNVKYGGSRPTTDNILKVDRNTVFLTKKNLMMNQFLEYSNATPTSSMQTVKLADKNKRVPWFHPSLQRSQFDPSEPKDRRSKKCNDSAPPVLCGSTSVLLDKRIVSLLRGITLYWFICLNTVLAKNELKRKNPIVLDGDCETTAASTNSTAILPFSRALAELQVSLNLLENAYDLENDVLWNLFRDSFIAESQFQEVRVVLPFELCLKNDLLKRFVRSLFSTWLTIFQVYEMPSMKRLLRVKFGAIKPYDREGIGKMTEDTRVNNDIVRFLGHLSADERIHLFHPFYNRPELATPYYRYETHPTPSESTNAYIPEEDDEAEPPIAEGLDSHDHGMEPSGLVANLNGPSNDFETETMDVEHQPSSLADIPFEICEPFGIVEETALDLRTRSQSVSPDGYSQVSFTSNRSDLPLDLRRRRTVSPGYDSADVVEASDRTPRVAEVQGVASDTESRVCTPMSEIQQNLISHKDYWKLMARRYGDPETNAAFENEAAEYSPALTPAESTKVEPPSSPRNFENVDEFPDNYVREIQLTPAESTKVEPPSSPRDFEDVDEFPDNVTEMQLTPVESIKVEPPSSPRDFEDVDEFPDNVTEMQLTPVESIKVEPPSLPRDVESIDEALENNLREMLKLAARLQNPGAGVEDGDHCDECWAVRIKEEPVEPLDDPVEPFDGPLPGYVPPAPAISEYDRSFAERFGVKILERQLPDANPPVKANHFHHEVYSPSHPDVCEESVQHIKEDDQELYTLANDPSTEFEPLSDHKVELPPCAEVGPLNDYRDEVPLSAFSPLGADWSRPSSLSASADTDIDSDTEVDSDSLCQSECEEISVDDLKSEPVDSVAAENGSVCSGCDAQSSTPPTVYSDPYQLSTPGLAAQLQPQDAALDLDSSWATASSTDFNTHESLHLGSQFLFPTANHSGPFSTASLSDSDDHFSTASLSGSDDTDLSDTSVAAVKEESEADDSELVALNDPTKKYEPKNRIPNENRSFLPQGIASGSQHQQCAEYNMWHSPWVNSVQLLRQQPSQPLTAGSGSSLSETDFPPYQMWKAPIVNFATTSSSYSPQLPTTSAAWLQLQPPTCRSSAVSSNSTSSAEYSLWSSTKLVDVERQLFTDKNSNPVSNHSRDDSLDGVCVPGHIPNFMPLQGRVSFSDRGAFQYYQRQPLIIAKEDVEMRSPPLVAHGQYLQDQDLSTSAGQDMEIDEEVRNLTDEDDSSSSSSSVPLDSPYIFRPIAPAFKVVVDAQPLMLRSASGLEYHQNGRKLLVFQDHQKSKDPYLFQPKYAVSLNDKACQTEPDLMYALAMSSGPNSNVHSFRGDSSNGSRLAAHTQRSPPLSQLRMPQHHQPTRQPMMQQHWSARQVAVAMAAAASSSSSWSNLQLTPTSQPAPTQQFWPAPPPALPAQPWPPGQPQYYGLEDVFNHLGQPGLANVR